jgi:coatomer subunit beta'
MGYDLGTIVVKLGSETPITSMDRSGTVLWAKNNEIQTVSLRFQSTTANGRGGGASCILPVAYT